jgi:molybdenum cofactor guanylyltransferase
MDVNRDLYILCGGKSKRMGSDKSQLKINGSSFLTHLVNRTNTLFNSVILLSGTYPINDTEHRQIPDAVPDAGPLGGLLAAVHNTSGTSIAILAVDLPLISDRTLKRLQSCSPDPADALVAKSKQRVQPLAGIYRTKIATALEDYLQSGRRSVVGFFEEIHCDYFSVEEHEIRNINTPEDYHRFIKKRDF